MTATTAATGPGTAGALGPASLGTTLLVTLALAWPMLAVTAPLGFFDTGAYANQGQTAWAILADGLGLANESPGGVDGGDGGEAAAATEGLRVLRSPGYAAFVGALSYLPAGLVLATLLQAGLTLILANAAFLDPRPRAGVLAAGILYLATVTTLPWFVAYAMPDLLAAAVVAFYLVLLRPRGRPGGAARLALAAVAAFAVSTHYGYLPLAAGLLVVTLALLALGRRLSPGAVVLGLLPILAAAALNSAAAVALDDGPDPGDTAPGDTAAARSGGPSLAPKRLPILLARSIDDGPAYWHLRDACPEADYAVCDIYDEIPSTIGAFLWGEDGLNSRSPAALDAIRDEEMAILWAAFRDYPLAQSRALVGNAARQTIRVGTGEIYPLTRPADAGGDWRVATAGDYPVLSAFDPVVKLGTLGGLLALAALGLSGRLTRLDVERLVLLAAALAGNAAIYGGLSAPVDRYQSRLVWLIPALAIAILARRRTADRPEVAAPGRDARVPETAPGTPSQRP